MSAPSAYAPGDRYEGMEYERKRRSMFITMLSFFLSFFFSLFLLGRRTTVHLSYSSCRPLLIFFSCPFISTAALAPPYMPPFLPLLPVSHSLTPLSSFSLSAVQHGDYHSTHRVRPDSQILLSTILHHLLLVGAMEGEKLRQRKRDDVGGSGWGGGMLQNKRDERENERRVNEG